MEEKLSLRKSNSTFKMVIPKNVVGKIRYLCNAIHDVEWSGVLFYSTEGTFEDSSFKVICKDICLMDIGSAAFTEFIDSPDIITYRAYNDLLGDDIHEALIHSHNNMATFFSGTDINTLAKEGSISNHFVSLIVNNEGTYTAAVTRKITSDIKAKIHINFTTNESYNTYNNDIIHTKINVSSEEDKESESKTKYVEYFYLDIEKEEEKEETERDFKDLDERIREVKDSKESKVHSYWKNDYHTKSLPYFSPHFFPQRNLNLFRDAPLCLTESFDPKIIRSLCAQLLTGSIMANDRSINFTEWVKKMDILYRRRFGDLTIKAHGKYLNEEYNTKLVEWVELMCEALVYTRDEKLLKKLNANGDIYNESDTVEVCAAGMYQFLMNLPDSCVKNLMCDQLLTYIPKDAREYFIY